MTEKDFAIGITGAPTNVAISKKPCYLVWLDVSKTHKGRPFIALDKPSFEMGFIHVKGFYSVEKEDDIIVRFSDLIRDLPKEEIVEIYVPWHRIDSIRSLVFNANKPATLIK
jgi:hypothetical protein